MQTHYLPRDMPVHHLSVGHRANRVVKHPRGQHDYVNRQPVGTSMVWGHPGWCGGEFCCTVMQPSFIL